MATLAFLLLIAALILFLVSTRQWPLPLRGTVWGVGVALLIFAALLLGNTARDPELGQTLADLFSKLTRPNESRLAQMLANNGASVARIVLSLFDLFIFFAAIVSILALVAFLPGEALEKAIRPVMIGIIGAIAGGLVALAIVGTGFGTREARRTYDGPVLPGTVESGDTLLLNGDLVRLGGIDAPEMGQFCRRETRTRGRLETVARDCGLAAQTALRRMLEGAYVACAVDDQVAGGRTVNCTAHRGGGQFNIARQMVLDGYAIGLQGRFEQEAEHAADEQFGLWTSCVVQPATWARFTPAQRTAFQERGTLPERTTPTWGTCPRQSQQRRSPTSPAVSAPD